MVHLATRTRLAGVLIAAVVAGALVPTADHGSTAGGIGAAAAGLLLMLMVTGATSRRGQRTART